MFFGAYKGDTDAGSNQMKKWFWNYKITPTLKQNENEPLVEVDICSGGNTSSDATYTEENFYDSIIRHDLVAKGVELLKLDAWWSSDWRSRAPHYGCKWMYDPVRWPNWENGVTPGTMAHDAGLKLSLYMSNTFENVDISTPEGREHEKQALIYRYENWHYDYWRTDIEFEWAYNYLSHEGFLEIIDYMIDTYPDFRWENCSSGGSKKSFDFCERNTFITTEDSGSGLGSVLSYRKAYYSNSYMINPVQLKDDNGDPKIGEFPGGKEYMFRTAFMGAWLWGADEPSDIYRQHVELYKTRQRPILRGADVYHILPMPDGVNWDGMQFYNTELDKGSAVLFRPSDEAPESMVIKLKGLAPEKTYALSFQDRPNLDCRMTGAALMEDGVNVTGMDSIYASEIIGRNLLHKSIF
jgi:hypothetical protein